MIISRVAEYCILISIFLVLHHSSGTSKQTYIFILQISNISDQCTAQHTLPFHQLNGNFCSQIFDCFIVENLNPFFELIKMVFGCDSLPYPKWMKSPRTVFVLFGKFCLFSFYCLLFHYLTSSLLLPSLAVVYFSLLIVLLFSYFNYIKQEFQSDTDLKIKPEGNTGGKWLIRMFGLVNWSSHSIAAVLIGYGLYFVVRDSYRLRNGYPLHHPRGSQAQPPTGSGSRRAKNKYYRENTVTTRVPASSSVQLLPPADCRQATTIVIHQ